VRGKCLSRDLINPPLGNFTPFFFVDKTRKLPKKYRDSKLFLIFVNR
jgi:hypothetical protein